jgi:protein gp37
MGETRIEWSDAVWNPVTGCTKVSAGCKNCYAETLAERFWAKQYPKVPDEGFGIPGAVNQLRSREFTDVLFHEDRLALPLGWKKPRRVFVNSMSDLFHERLPDDAIDRIFAVMALTPRHTYQVLTKRPERMLAYVTEPARGHSGGLIWYVAEKLKPSLPPPRHWYHAPRSFAWPLENVWLGVSVEDQAAADARIPLLLQTPAAVRFLSVEPLLAQVDLSKWLHDRRREGVPGSSGPGSLQGGVGRDDLAACRMDGHRESCLRDQDAGRAQRGATWELSAGHVQGRGSPAEGQRTPYCLDGCEQATDTDGHGNQSHRREQTEQLTSQLGAREPSAECTALPYAFGPEEKGSTGREELVGSGDRTSGVGDQVHLDEQGHVPAGHRGNVQNYSIDGLGDRHPQELGPSSIDWVICGAESGRGARPCDLAWVRSLRDQCSAAGVAFFFKQRLDERGRKVSLPTLDGRQWAQMP